MRTKMTVWDSYIMTVGSIVRLSGYAMCDDKTFKGKEYEIISRHYDMLVVESKKGRKYEINVMDVDDGLKIEMVKQAPWSMPF